MKSLEKLLMNLENAGVKTKNIHMIQFYINSPLPYVMIINNREFHLSYEKASGKMDFMAFVRDEDRISEIKEMIPLFKKGLDEIILKYSA